MRIAWSSKGPPPIMMLSGDNRFLRRRAIHHLVTQAYKAGYEVNFASSDGEVVDATTMASTFGQPALIVVNLNDVSVETASIMVEEKPPMVGILIEVDGPVVEVKMPVAALVHGAHHTSFNLPEKKGLNAFALRFIRHESDRLIGEKGTLDNKLAHAIVQSVGVDLGMLAYEASKFTALVRSRGGSTVTVVDLKTTVRGSAAADMQPIRTALADANGPAMAAALYKVRRKSVTDPTMLLLRARGGPADLAYQWLRAALMLKRGAGSASIASALGSPEWAVTRDVIPAAKRWGFVNLTELVGNLALVDRGVQSGIPAPWVACEAALLAGCLSVGRR